MGASNPTELKCVSLSAHGCLLVGLSESLEVFRFPFGGGGGELVLHSAGRIE